MEKPWNCRQLNDMILIFKQERLQESRAKEIFGPAYFKSIFPIGNPAMAATGNQNVQNALNLYLRVLSISVKYSIFSPTDISKGVAISRPISLEVQ